MLLRCFLVFLIAFLSFLLQAWPRFLPQRRYFGVDCWRILLIANYIRENKRWFPDKLSNQYIIQGPYDHPVVLSLLLSLFPKKAVEKYQWVVSPFIESLHGLFLFSVTYLLTRNFTVALLAQGIYALVPLMIIQSSQLSSRSIGPFLFSLSFLPMLCYVIQGHLLWALAAIFFTTLLFYTHRMATQSLFFLVILLSILYRDPSFLALFGISFLCALIFFKGKYLNILKGQLILINLWRKNYQNRYAHQVRGNPKGEGRDIIRRMERQVLRLPVISLLAPDPWMIFPLIFLFLVLSHKVDLTRTTYYPQIFQMIVVWSFAIFLFGVLTSAIRPLRFLGTGERYLESGAFPTALASAVIISRFWEARPNPFYPVLFVLFALFTCILPSLFLQKKVVVEGSDKAITPSFRKVLDFLGSTHKREEVRIACIPHQLADAVLYFTPCKVFLTDSNTGNKEILAYWWPIITKPLSEIFRKYRINYLLISENYVKLLELKLPHSKVVFRAENFLVIKV